MMVAAGLAIFVAYLMTRVVFKSSAPSAAVMMLLGMLSFAFVPSMPDVLNPTVSPHIWELSSEVAVIVVLFATGLRIDRIGNWRRWQPTVRLLVIAMPLTIAALAFLGWALAGMTLAGALLLGAVLSPTDPVLAGDVQVGPPLEGQEHPVRLTLTAEAGLNDGFAFPFVHLAVILATVGTDTSDWFIDWLLQDVVYRLTVGAIVGALIGWALGKALFSEWGSAAIEKSGPGVLVLGAVFLCYGVVELAEGYGFVGAFAAGLVCRRMQEEHDFHRRLHAFSEAVEHSITAALLFALGGLLPILWPVLDWRHTLIGFGLLFVIRPLIGWLSLIRTDLSQGDRLIVGFFGVRGIGSVYYLGYASGKVELVNEDQLWALVAYTIFASALLHGATSFVVERYTSRWREPATLAKSA
ncbi:MAG: cation:proton antiporter [Candidatus Saccharibacteria bacterium]|nr:cation:proton antiporter [Pseudorhodobacter sp.]